MNYKEMTRLELVEGGNVFRQGSYVKLSFAPRDYAGNIVDLTGKDIAVAIWNKKGIVYEGTASYDEDDQLIRLMIEEVLQHGKYNIEFTATSVADTTYRQKFPSSEYEGQIQIKPSADSMDVVGVQMVTVEQLRSEQQSAQETFEAEVIPRVETVESKTAEMESTLQTGIGAFTEDTEVVVARGGEVNLGARLDKTTAQLADIDVNKELADFDLFGLVYPDGFPVSNIPFTAYRTLENVIQHDYDFDSAEVGAGHIYINGYDGSNNNDGLTANTPVSTFADALTKANALVEGTVVIHLQENAYDDSRFAPMSFTLEKNIIIKSDAPRGKTFWHTGNRYNSATWIADGTAYKYARSTVTQLFDTAIQDGDLPKRYAKKSSIAEVQAEPGTWYTDGTTVWVRRIGDLVPDKDIALIITRIGMNFNIGTHKLITRNIEFFCEANGDDALSVLSSVDAGEYWNESCVFAGSLTRNGLEIKGVKKTYSFESVATENYLDGFNYHANAVLATNDEFAFEYKCKSYDNGDPAISNSNATTAHDGYTILRLACVGHSTHGPILADVNGCFSVNFDCLMYNSLRSAGAAKVAYYFDAAGAVKEGKAYLINCAGGGVDTLSITGDANLPIYVRNFKGRDIYSSSVINAY